MTIPVSDEEFAFLREIIKKKTEIAIGDNKKYLIETRLSPLVLETGCLSFSEFCALLSNYPRSMDLMNQVIEAITIQETYWFRDQYPFDYFSSVFLPGVMPELQAGRRSKIHIWSAAAACGQEAYSMAIAALEFVRERPGTAPVEEWLSIVATDISNRAIQKASAGVYDFNDMNRGLSRELKDRYFVKTSSGWRLIEAVRSLARFSVFNLQVPLPDIWGLIDVILLRNVIIYFDDAFKRVLLNRIARRLAPDGVLFLGTGESPGGYTEAFSTHSFQKAKYYRLAS